MFKKSIFLFCTMALAAAFALTPVAGQTQKSDDKAKSADIRELEKQARQLDQQSAKEPNDKSFALLSKELDVPAATLQSEKQSTNFGFGQLFIANALAKASGKTFDQIAGEFRGGKGWGEIAAQNGVKLGPVVSQIKSSNKAMNHQENSEAHGSQGAPAKGSPTQGKSGPPTTGRGRGGR